jgi:hypothetical protein
MNLDITPLFVLETEEEGLLKWMTIY